VENKITHLHLLPPFSTTPPCPCPRCPCQPIHIFVKPYQRHTNSYSLCLTPLATIASCSRLQAPGMTISGPLLHDSISSTNDKQPPYSNSIHLITLCHHKLPHLRGLSWPAFLLASPLRYCPIHLPIKLHLGTHSNTHSSQSSSALNKPTQYTQYNQCLPGFVLDNRNCVAACPTGEVSDGKTCTGQSSNSRIFHETLTSL
jgi:hypothetical protein